MDLYTFKVDNIRINETRSPETDTLHLVYAAFVDGDMVAQKPLSLGDLGFVNDYNPDDLVPEADKGGLARVVINDPKSKVAFSFQLLNAGNVPAGALAGRVSATADQMAGIGAGLAGAGAQSIEEVLTGGLFWASIALEAFATLYAWLNVDCDGPVAVDQISGPRYVLDAWTDNASQTFQISEKHYPGIDSPSGCGATSDYRASWSLRRSRAWVRVTDEAQRPYNQPLELGAEHGAGAAAHNGAVYVLGTGETGDLLAARSFTGATWNITLIGSVFSGGFPILPVSAVSFNDRLYVLGVQPNGSITTLAYTADGGSWTQFTTSTPRGLRTETAITTTVSGHRLYVIAKDSSTNHLRMTSTDDLVTWDPWTDIPEPRIGPPSALARWTATSVAAAALADALHIFAVYSRSAGGVALSTRAHAPDPTAKVLLRNSTLQGTTWTGWQEVERGTKLEGGGMPLDVGALAFQDRIHIASRWDTVRIPLPERDTFSTDVIAVNFSEDGDNWSGWRIPIAEHPGVLQDRTARATAALAGLGNHLYIFASDPVERTGPPLPHAGYVVWAY